MTSFVKLEEFIYGGCLVVAFVIAILGDEVMLAMLASLLGLLEAVHAIMSFNIGPTILGNVEEILFCNNLFQCNG